MGNNPARDFSCVVLILYICAWAISIHGVSSHIRLIEPSQRSSLWRNPEYAKFSPRINLRDDELWCDYVLQPPVPVNCGVCGDPFTDPQPRANEHGGIYGQGIISRKYTSGEEIPISARVRIPHNGSFHIQLCDQFPESEFCFFNNPKLEIKTKKGIYKDYPVVGTSNTPYWINGSVKLPQGVDCNKCVLRLSYRAGYLGQCEDGSEDYGCGLQITFRNCVDLSISPKASDKNNYTMLPYGNSQSVSQGVMSKYLSLIICCILHQIML